MLTRKELGELAKLPLCPRCGDTKHVDENVFDMIWGPDLSVQTVDLDGDVDVIVVANPEKIKHV